MRTLQRTLLPALLFLPLLCQAKESCLWLNAATAGGILGGTVAATVSRATAAPLDTHTANAKSSAGPTSANPSAASYSSDDTDDSDCIFMRRQGSIADELRIEVRTMNDPASEFARFAARCGAHADPLKAIGNEAAACSLNGKGAELLEQVVGRVRERAFVIRLSVNDSSLTQSMLREKCRKAAELVAGNLF